MLSESEDLVRAAACKAHNSGERRRPRRRWPWPWPWCHLGDGPRLARIACYAGQQADCTAALERACGAEALGALRQRSARRAAPGGARAGVVRPLLRLVARVLAVLHHDVARGVAARARQALVVERDNELATAEGPALVHFLRRVEVGEGDCGAVARVPVAHIQRARLPAFAALR